MIYINQFLKNNANIKNYKFFDENNNELIPTTTTSFEILSNRNKIFYKIKNDDIFIETLNNNVKEIYNFIKELKK